MANETQTSSNACPSLPQMQTSDAEEQINMKTTFQEPDYVVAIGASAGGLDALERFFTHLPQDSGAAYVVIQHLSPDHKSIMDSLLARHTSMPVRTVTHNMGIEANSVYLIPPGSMMQVEGHKFLLTPKYPRALSLPVDVFFQSLASSFKEKSVGVVLSGTGSDGTRGAATVNEAGGFLVAQEPETAKFDGMPRSVISTGLVDVILPVELMGDRIYAHVKNQSTPPQVIRHIANETAEEKLAQAYKDILHLLSQVGGINFAEYKPGTVSRRIERRMAVRQVNTLEQYFALLNEEHTEILTLRRELLIPVTSFFRDTEAYEALKRNVVDAILSNRHMEQGIRIWCAGISTGEEAYSIAMMFLEACDQAKRWPTLKIFATDVEQLNIDTASAGIYPESIIAEVSPEQLERFFNKRGNQYVVKNNLRQCLVFAKHNLLSDPPFTKMDLVVCRNVLIYFSAEAQQRVLRRLQYALKPNSFLFLGSSESLGDLQSDFHPLSPRQKIWKILKTSPMPLDVESRLSFNASPSSIYRRTKNTSHWKEGVQSVSMVQRGYDTLLRAFEPPPAILVGPNQELIHSYGDVSRYLQIRAGQASLEVVRMLPDPLIPVAAALLFKSIRESASTISDVVYIQSGKNTPENQRIAIRLSAWPVSATPTQDKDRPLTLLVFEEINESVKQNSAMTVDVQLETSERMEVLQNELAATRESLQATIEELETSNEELQATNEEMMASNEELQSSNEELQSVNEELNTVNAEYQEKIEILNRVNADLDNLAKVVASGTIFIDDQLNLTRFSPDANKLFKLRDSDIGRPLSDISHVLDYPDLAEDLSTAMKTGQMIEKDVIGPDQHLFLVKMLPYQVSSSEERGLVINFIDITSVRKASKLQPILDASLECMAVIDFQGEIILCNNSWSNGSNLFEEPFNPTSVALGENYLDFCNRNLYSKPWTTSVLEELKKILTGEKTGFQLRLDSNKVIFSAKSLSKDKNGILIQIINKIILED